ncbi:MAG: alpha amylase C-terminal domain-containing protein, partial [Casimicrobiaceae bacterium]
PDVQTIAEESTAWPQVSRPTWLGGLGFGMKWNMGWMHDVLDYFHHEPVHRAFHQGSLTFSLWYAFNENFVLPLSHDEVVYGKGSLIGKMPGDDWQRFANLRLLFGYMWGHPGKKLLFMGGEFAQWREWDHDRSLDWHLADYPLHAGMQRWIRDLNLALARSPALHARDFDADGFAWVDASDTANSIVSFVRSAPGDGPLVLVVCNLTPIVRNDYRIGVPRAGRWRELLNSDASCYGGSGIGNLGGADTQSIAAHGHPQSIALSLPPLCALFFESD